MVGKQLAIAVELLHCLEESFQLGGIIQVRCHIPHLAINLCQCRTAETVLAITQVYQQQY